MFGNKISSEHLGFRDGRTGVLLDDTLYDFFNGIKND